MRAYAVVRQRYFVWSMECSHKGFAQKHVKARRSPRGVASFVGITFGSNKSSRKTITGKAPADRTIEVNRWQAHQSDFKH
jgi:hypothetical protein